MPKPNHVGALEVHQDISHTRREWKMERVGWIVMALLLLTALVGLLGPGPISSATAGEKNSALWVEYNRFERYNAPAILRVHLGPENAHDGTAEVWLSRQYVESIEMRHIDPEPESVKATPDRFIYTFNLSGSDEPTAVSFHFEAGSYWRMPVSLGLVDGPQLDFTQVFYP